MERPDSKAIKTKSDMDFGEQVKNMTRSNIKMASKKEAISFFYPERRFAGFARNEGRFIYFSLVASCLSPKSVVLDLGAGRGAQIENSEGYLQGLINFHGRCQRYIGVDVDPVVLENPYVDEAHIIEEDGRIPLPDASVDLITAFAVLEHVAQPGTFSSEVKRVLRPGGWFCAWTPNKWGYVGLAARIIPNRLHAGIVAMAEPLDKRTEDDVFPTKYAMNTKFAINFHFPETHYEDYTFYDNGPPSYHFNKVILVYFWKFVMLATPNILAKSLFVFIKKRQTPLK